MPSSSKSKVSPVGLKLGKQKGGKGFYRIGKFIGEGAQASVHAIVDEDGAEIPFVAKVAPVPPKSGRKNKIMEQNYRSIFGESVLYQNTFSSLLGSYLPSLSTSSAVTGLPVVGLPVYGRCHNEKNDTDFCFLVIERMEAPLFSIVPTLVSLASPKNGVIDLAPIGVRLLKITETFHDRHYVLVDVKPENFMLAVGQDEGQKKGSSVSAAEQSLADRIRLLDLGMLQRWRDFGGKRPNQKGDSLQGTPLYASLNLHNHETPSRRDDLEALCYVLAELVIYCQAQLHGTVDQYEKDGRKKMLVPSYLPWSQEQSDEAVGAVKREEVENPRSSFYRRMPDEAAETIQALLATVRGYSFKEDPDYKALNSILSGLKVPLPKKTTAKPNRKKTPRKAASGPKAPPSAGSRTKAPTFAATMRSASVGGSRRYSERLAVARGDTDANESGKAEHSNPKRRATNSRYGKCDDSDESSDDESPRKLTKTGHPMDYKLIHESEETDGSDVGDSRHSDGMDIDSASEDGKPASSGHQKLLGVLIEFTEGPHKGESFKMIEGRNEKVTLGRNPKAKTGVTCVALRDDTELADSHVRLELHVNVKGNFCQVNVVDLKSSGGCFVSETQVPCGKSTMAFGGDSVELGGSVFFIRKISSKKDGKEKTTVNGAAIPSRAARRRCQGAAAKENVVPNPGNNRKLLSVTLVATKGEQIGETWDILEGQQLLVGSSPSSENNITLTGDSEIEKEHARFELVVNKGVTTIAVSDLGTRSGTYVGGAKVRKGKKLFARRNQSIRFGKTTIKYESSQG